MTDEPAHPSTDDPGTLDRASFDLDTLDPAMLAQLACPACHGELRHEGTRLRCMSCSRGYPIVEGIPVMIVDRAERLLEQP
jgi:uncharacterized protein YbaR (Trm112 family)